MSQETNYSANPGKQLSRTVDGVEYLRIPVKTHLITKADDMADVVTKYARDKMQPGDILIHGHTHLLRADKIGDITVLNPGSVSIPKGGNPNTYALLDGNTFSIRSLDGDVVKELELERTMN